MALGSGGSPVKKNYLNLVDKESMCNFAPLKVYEIEKYK